MVEQASFYLQDSASLWWRCLSNDIDNGVVAPIETWEDFCQALKGFFYPAGAELEAKMALFNISQKGTLKEYVKEFNELRLQNPGTDEDTLRAIFTKGLKPWARVELERRRCDNVYALVSTADSLTEYSEPRPTSPKSSHKDLGGGEDSGTTNGGRQQFHHGDKGKGNQESKPWKSKRPDKPPSPCKICKGPHWTNDCPNRAIVNAMFCDKGDGTEEENSDEDAPSPQKHMGAMHSLNTMSTAHPAKRGGLLFAKMFIEGKKFTGLVDTGASDLFISESAAKRLKLPLSRDRQKLKAVNSEAIQTAGVARDVAVRLGQWSGSVDLTAIPMDDHDLVIGVGFLDHISAIVETSKNSLVINDPRNPCIVPLWRARGPTAKVLSSMQMTQGAPQKLHSKATMPRSGPKDSQVPGSKASPSTHSAAAQPATKSQCKTPSASARISTVSELRSPPEKDVAVKIRRDTPSCGRRKTKAPIQEYQVGDLVRVKLPRHKAIQGDKFHGRRRHLPGAYRILKKVGKAAYLLEIPRSLQQHPVFHAGLLRRHSSEEPPKSGNSSNMKLAQHQPPEVEAKTVPDNGRGAREVSLPIEDLGQPGATAPRTSPT